MIIVDNKILRYIPLHVAESVITAWPSEDWDGWHRYQGEMGDKLASKPDVKLPDAVYAGLWHMAKEVSKHMAPTEFIDFGLHGAGMHWIRPGGRLPRHLDSERHPTQPWVRMLSAVCFLDSMDKGGELVLNDGESMAHPDIGQIVIFETRDNWHWVNRTFHERRTLALFGWKYAANISVLNMRTRALFQEQTPERLYSPIEDSQ